MLRPWLAQPTRRQHSWLPSGLPTRACSCLCGRVGSPTFLGGATFASAVVAAMLLLGSPLQAVEIEVNTTEDTLSGPGCSLRAALRASDLDEPVGGCAPGGLGLDRVLLPTGVFSLLPEGPGELGEESGDLDVTGPVEIVGNGPDHTVLQPAGGLVAATDRILEVSAGGVVTVRGVSIREGRAELGGGLKVGPGGALTLSDCRVLANEASSGGGLYLERGTATIERCEILQNRAAAGGGIFQFGGTLTVQGSLLEQNEARAADPWSGSTESSGGGGALAKVAGSTEIATSQIVGNHADDTRWGGGGILATTGALTVSRSTLAHNTATDAAGDGSVADVDYDESGGGAISAWGATVGIENTTLSGNSADQTRWGGGGILSVDSEVTVSHATLWDNAAEGGRQILGNHAGGSLAVFPRLAEAAVPITLESSILAGASPAECFDGSDTMSGGVVPNNAIDDISCAALASSIGPVTGFDIRLGDYGGPTRTHRLLAGSNAIDAAGNECLGADGGSLLVGQRGVARPQGGGCDLGAVERMSNVDLAVSGQVIATLAEPGGVVSANLSFDNPGPLPVEATLGIADEVTDLGTCGPSVEVTAGSMVECQVELTVSGNAGPLGVEIPIATSSPDATNSENLVIDFELSDVLPVVGLTASMKPRALEAPGGEVTLHLAVRNESSNETISVLSLDDALSGPLVGDCASIAPLAPREIATCAVTVQFDGVAGQSPTRTLTVTAEDDEGNSTSDVVVVGPQIVEAGSIIFQDCFDSGDLAAWSFSAP